MSPTIPSLLRQIGGEAPDRPAIYLLLSRSERLITWRELIEGATGYGLALDGSGIKPGEVVVLILPHGESLVYSFLGAMLVGAIPSIMPFLTEKLSPEHYARSLASLIDITRPAAIVTYPAFAQSVRAALRPGSSVRAVLQDGDIGPERSLEHTALPMPRLSPDDICLLQHSSGTTGLQKGVALSHRAVLNQVDCYSNVIRMSTQDTVVSWLPLYHDMGLIAGFIMPLLCAAPLVLMSPFDWVHAPWRLMRAISDHRGTLSWLPNFAYDFCASKIRDRDLEGVDLSSWRAVINCSEPMRYQSHEAFSRRFQSYGLYPRALATCYAMAENVFAVSQGGIDKPVTIDPIDARALVVDRVARPATGGAETWRMLSCGRPIPNTRVRVLDEKRVGLPDRQIGEIAILSDCMLVGYFHRQDLTAQAFHDGWYLTGDLGYVADGEVYVTGRKKDLIIVGGKNIYPEDIEGLVAEAEGNHPGRVVAFGVFDDELGTEEVVVVAEADVGSVQERRRISDEIRARLTRGSDVALRIVEIVDPKWLVKTSSGKIARSANREKYLSGETAAIRSRGLSV